jgi:hypothetical protein
VTLELAESYCASGEKVAASVKVRGNDLTPVGNADVALCLSTTGQTNVIIPAAYDRVNQAYEADLAPPSDGTFTVTASATMTGKKLGEDRQLLVCESGDREMADLRANPELMANLARISGGKTFSLSEQHPQLSSVFGSPAPASVEYRHTPLWDKWWWLSLILVLLTLEWSARRLSGMA